MARLQSDILHNVASVAGSMADENEIHLQEPMLVATAGTCTPSSGLQRRHSTHMLEPGPTFKQARCPRRMSFSEAEEAILGWDDVIALGQKSQDVPGNSLDLFAADSQAEHARSLYGRLSSLQADLVPWVSARVCEVGALNGTFGSQQAELHDLYSAVSEAYQRLVQQSGELVSEERSRLQDAFKEVEVLMAKLEYEIGALVGRVEDVEDGVEQFERQVRDVERRADELKAVLETESWPHWLVRTLTGIGTGPNITRGNAVTEGAEQKP